MRLGWLALAVVVSACPRPADVNDAGAAPDTLTLTGRVCTSAPDFGSFSTRVFVLLDQRALMCRLDPPGTSLVDGLCRGSPDEPVRARVLTSFFRQLATRNVQVSLVPYGKGIGDVWPEQFGVDITAPPDSSLTNRVAQAPLMLGDATSDLQTALTFTRNAIQAEASRLFFTAREQLARTRYVVLVVSGGPPAPRCNSNKARPVWADDRMPFGEWPDTHLDLCNDIAQTALLGFNPGESHNQDAQLLHEVFQLRALIGQLRLGDVQVNTVQLTNDAALAACGPTCAQLYGRKLRGGVEVSADEVPAFVKIEARAILQQLAELGGGTYSEQDVTAFALDRVDTSTLFALPAVRSLFVQPRHATLGAAGWELDTDGDGLSDATELALGTAVIDADSDDDGFEDRFEVVRAGEGFDPLTVDARACNPQFQFCDQRDLDGDGLAGAQELFLQTDPAMVDSDGDGVPDGLEVRWGLSPTASNEGRDGDADGVRDLDEVMRGTDPLVPDAQLEPFTPQLQLTDDGDLGNGAHCYRWAARRLPLAPTLESRAPAVFTPAGANQYRVWFSWAPKDAAFSFGEWANACVWARRDGDTRVPESLSFELERGFFGPPADLGRPCAGTMALLR